MSIYSLIVTYSNRFSLLERVIHSCFDEGIDKIVVVDNHSSPESLRALQQLEETESRLKVLYQPENLGSAGGYKVGLEYISESCADCDYIWMLDDDNKPEAGSLNILGKYWIDNKLDNSLSALMSYRPDRTAYRIAIRTGNPDHVLERPNSFWGFHILNIPLKILKVLSRKMGFSVLKEDETIQSGRIAVATYGGMYFHKDLLKTIGYPDESYFVYADDHQWSYRVTKQGGRIDLVLESLLEDIDTSWNVPDKRQTVFDVIGKGSDFRIYYSVRNRILFERENLVKSYPVYKFHLMLFQLLFTLIALRKGYKTGTILKKSIKDGLSGKKGQNSAIK